MIKCGWCITGNHSDCKPTLKYYEKTWYCSCDCEKATQARPEAKANQQDKETNG